MSKAIFTFGRFQPPTIGHQKVINSMVEQSVNEGCDHFVFCSQSHDQKRNPISPQQKIQFMETLFPEANIVSLETGVINPFQAAKILSDSGYTDVKMFVGEDRADEFEKSIRPYINHPDESKSYKFESFEVVNVGSRLNEDDVSQASGSKARQAAIDGNFELFSSFIPTDNVNIVESIYHAIREGTTISDVEKMRDIIDL